MKMHVICGIGVVVFVGVTIWTLVAEYGWEAVGPAALFVGAVLAVVALLAREFIRGYDR